MTDDKNPNGQTNAESGKYRAERPVIKIDSANVPPELHSLIPYAERWGISDEELRTTLLHEAPLAEIEELYRAFYPAWADVNRFIRSHSESDESLNKVIEIFEAFRPVFAKASSILIRERPEAWLEIVGGPENFPSFPFDPTKFPPELQPLISHIEKWAKEDDGVRWAAVRVATDKELDQLVSVVDRIGEEVIRDLAFEIRDEAKQEESYVLLIFLELVEQAKLQLKRPHGGKR